MIGVLARVSDVSRENGLDVGGIVEAISNNSEALNSLGNFDAMLDDVPSLIDDLKRGLSQLFGR